MRVISPLAGGFKPNPKSEDKIIDYGRAELKKWVHGQSLATGAPAKPLAS